MLHAIKSYQNKLIFNYRFGLNSLNFACPEYYGNAY